MKHLLLTLCLLSILCLPLLAQTAPIEIGDGNTGFNTPVYPSKEAYYSQNIYLPGEIDVEGHWITKIAFQWLGGNYLETPQHIQLYMGLVADTNFGDIAGLITSEEMTLVYDGNTTNNMTYFSGTAAGWKEFTLLTPFPYDHTQSLVVGFFKEYSTHLVDNDDATAPTQRFAGTATAATNRSLVYASSTAFTVENIVGVADADKHLIEGYANICIYSEEMPTGPDVSVNPDEYYFGGFPPNNNGNHNFVITNNGLAGNITGIAITGEDADRYSFTPAFSTNISLAYHGTHTVNVVFASGTSIGTKNANLVFTIDGTDTVTVPLTAATCISIDSPHNPSDPQNLNPHHNEYDYAISQFIYLSSQIGTSMEIGKIALWWNGLSDGHANDYYEIYMGHKTENTFTGTSADSWLPANQLTQVFAGQIGITAENRWIEIPLDAPFIYNNSQNLVICFNEVEDAAFVDDQGYFLGTLSPLRGMRSQKNGLPPFDLTALSQPASQNIGGFPFVRLYVSDIPDITEVIEPVTGLVAALENHGRNVVLEWDAPDTTTPPQVYRVFKNQMILSEIPVGTTTFTNSEVAIGTYSYGVRAIYVTGFSEMVTTSVNIVAPLPVTDLTFTLTESNVTLNWVAPTGGEDPMGYNVYRGGTLLTTDDPITALTYTDSNVSDGTHAYHVRSVILTDESTPVTAYVVVGTLPPVTSLGATALNYNVTLAWTAPASAAVTGYKVWRGDALLTENPITEPTYTQEAVTAGTYTYTVKAVYGSQGESAAVTVDITVINMLPVTALSSTVTNGNAVLTWTAPASEAVTGYNVYEGATLLTTNPITNPTHTVPNVTTGEHTYGVKAIYAQGESAAETTAVTVIPRPPVTNLQANVEAYSVTLTWTAPADAPVTGYKVYRGAALLTEEPITGVTFTQNDVAPDTYTYGVVAVYAQGESATVTTNATVVIVKLPVTGLTATPTSGSVSTVVLAWTAPASTYVTGYKVYRATVAITTNPLPLTPTTYTDEGIPTGTYIYGVTAVYPNGESDITNADEVSLSDGDLVDIVTATALHTNYPNPFNPTTTIKFDIATPSHTSLEIYNVKGQKVKTLIDGSYGVGKHQVVWNGKDDSGNDVGGGIYFYRLNAGDYTSIRKMLLLK